MALQRFLAMLLKHIHIIQGSIGQAALPLYWTVPPVTVTPSVSDNTTQLPSRYTNIAPNIQILNPNWIAIDKKMHKQTDRMTCQNTLAAIFFSYMVSVTTLEHYSPQPPLFHPCLMELKQ